MAESLNLPEVAAYWSQVSYIFLTYIQQVLSINDYQKSRFVQKIIKAMFSNVSGKKIAILGFTFKKDTGDTRETAALTVIDKLLDEGAHLSIYDPAVEPFQIEHDMANYLDRPVETWSSSMEICKNVYDAALEAHALVICTEWDLFKKLDYTRIFQNMVKPAFIFDGRLILDRAKLVSIGFCVHTIGKSND